MVFEIPLKSPEISAQDDASVVRLAREGDLGACETLALYCRGIAYRVAFQILRNREDAMDIAQESLLRFFSSIRRFDCSRSIRPWIVRIAHNLSIDCLRRRKTRNNVPFSQNDRGMVIEPEDDRPGVDVRIERRELSRLVWESVSALDDKYREILILRDYNDLSYAEIASTLHIPLGTVMSRLHKARRLLADELAARGYSHPSRDEHTPPEGRSRVIPFDKRGKGE